ncbi:host cell division inhibitor Icd-like protein [Klebsiella pneumoniae]
MWVPVVDYSGCQMSVFAFTKKQRPTSVGSAGGASNHKPLVEVTVMAGSQHTQTRPKYTWRFLALNRLDKNAKPCRISVEAETELEARCILAQHFILSLSARLPIQGVYYHD